MLWLLLLLLLMLLLYMEESFMEFMDSEMESRGVRKADAEPGAKLLLIIPPLVVPVNGEVEMASFDVSSSIACGRVLISLAFRFVPCPCMDIPERLDFCCCCCNCCCCCCCCNCCCCSTCCCC